MDNQEDQANTASHVPAHVAIIMDGNGRWAERRGKPRSAGHRAGGDAVKSVIEAAYRAKVGFLTLFAFSSENWKRPRKEVDLLMDLFLRSLRKETRELNDNNVRVRFVGDLDSFSSPLQKEMKNAEKLTEENKGILVNIAVGYGGRWDIVQACRKLVDDVQQSRIESSSVDEKAFADRLSLQAPNDGIAVPDPDLLIRTGGEQRISNFLLWQMAYTELYFCDTLWPDFDEQAFNEALDWFTTRQRRFGRVPA